MFFPYNFLLQHRHSFLITEKLVKGIMNSAVAFMEGNGAARPRGACWQKYSIYCGRYGMGNRGISDSGNFCRPCLQESVRDRGENAA